MQGVSKSSQDFVVACPHYFDAEGFVSDLDVIAQVGGTSSVIKRLNIFMGDFIAHVIGIRDLSEKNKGTAPDKTISLQSYKPLSSSCGPPVRIASHS